MIIDTPLTEYSLAGRNTISRVGERGWLEKAGVGGFKEGSKADDARHVPFGEINVPYPKLHR